MGSKREKVGPSKVPILLFTVVSEQEMRRVVDRGYVRGAKDEPLALFERRSRATRGWKSEHVVLRIAARAAAEAGHRFARIDGRYETDRVALNFISCARLPRSVRGVTRVDAAGGVVVTSNGNRRVLVLQKGKGKRAHWVLPKGKRRRLEARRRAARREVLEETGLARVDVGKFLLRECYFDKVGREVLFKEVSYYLMRCPKGKERLRVRKAEGFERGEWVSFDDAFARTNPARAYRTLRKARAALKGS